MKGERSSKTRKKKYIQRKEGTRGIEKTRRGRAKKKYIYINGKFAEVSRWNTLLHIEKFRRSFFFDNEEEEEDCRSFLVRQAS